MANYGRLGPAGALRYCRSVSIDFEEEPSTQETEQREQALLQKLGFYDDRIEAKMRSDTEFHRIVGAQTKTNGTERKMTRESFLMAARQLWGLDHVQAAAAFASADLTGEDTLNKREYLLLREAFHHRDARPCAELDRMLTKPLGAHRHSLIGSAKFPTRGGGDALIRAKRARALEEDAVSAADMLGRRRGGGGGEKKKLAAPLPAAIAGAVAGGATGKRRKRS